ncbi:MAG: PilZ domain-containing protein [Chitinivibrionales bacterium]|nr:PilZ domain-containing protein [Chitinivibrionales bacterium]
MSLIYNEDKRKEQRLILTTFCPTTFDYQGRHHHALMINISRTGACFQQNDFHDHYEMQVNDEVVYTVKTPYGDSDCKGIVRWIDFSFEIYIWGIEFTQVSTENLDPLKCLIESSF